ncbi:hypothetical protein EK21DRAFT_95474 [Setomelanomma holmii]|uniref:Uncharacterized protein n=1 Tax=Setomelanomma holmii TaxID=210430 RepID=A0A9P4LEZ6_9PLEO|nr:hypothetical protein EK21DRAFT_95474 [Setomelanomma holmii]
MTECYVRKSFCVHRGRRHYLGQILCNNGRPDSSCQAGRGRMLKAGRGAISEWPRAVSLQWHVKPVRCPHDHDLWWAEMLLQSPDGPVNVRLERTKRRQTRRTCIKRPSTLCLARICAAAPLVQSADPGVYLTPTIPQLDTGIAAKVHTPKQVNLLISDTRPNSGPTRQISQTPSRLAKRPWFPIERQLACLYPLPKIAEPHRLFLPTGLSHMRVLIMATEQPCNWRSPHDLGSLTQYFHELEQTPLGNQKMQHTIGSQSAITQSTFM